MRDISEKRAVELRWPKVSGIVTGEIREVLGLQIQCKVNVVDGSFWDVTFIGYRIDVGGIGIVLAEKLLSRHLALTWEHHLITEDSLWLVGVTKEDSHMPKQN